MSSAAKLSEFLRSRTPQSAPFLNRLATFYELPEALWLAGRPEGKMLVLNERFALKVHPSVVLALSPANVGRARPQPYRWTMRGWTRVQMESRLYQAARAQTWGDAAQLGLPAIAVYAAQCWQEQGALGFAEGNFGNIAYAGEPDRASVMVCSRSRKAIQFNNVYDRGIESVRAGVAIMGRALALSRIDIWADPSSPDFQPGDGLSLGPYRLSRSRFAQAARFAQAFYVTGDTQVASAVARRASYSASRYAHERELVEDSVRLLSATQLSSGETNALGQTRARSTASR